MSVRLRIESHGQTQQYRKTGLVKPVKKRSFELITNPDGHQLSVRAGVRSHFLRAENAKESLLTSHNEMVKEQLLHMLFGTIIFVVLGAIAVGLDLAAAGVLKLGVSEFTHKAIEYAAHGVLLLDLVLFSLYLIRSSMTLVKEMFK